MSERTPSSKNFKTQKSTRSRNLAAAQERARAGGRGGRQRRHTLGSHAGVRPRGASLRGEGARNKGLASSYRRDECDRCDVYLCRDSAPCTTCL